MYSFFGIGLPDKSLDKHVQLRKGCIYCYVSAKCQRECVCSANGKSC